MVFVGKHEGRDSIEMGLQGIGFGGVGWGVAWMGSYSSGQGQLTNSW